MSNKIDLCKKIQSNIANLSSNEIDELFKILYKNNSNYTKNNNGIFVNLNWLDEKLLIEINDYISFCIKSQKEINNYEIMRNILNESMNKDKAGYIANDIINTNDIIDKNILHQSSINLNNKQKISSSMKFYLLKKKFLKQNYITNNYNDINFLLNVPAIVDTFFIVSG